MLRIPLLVLVVILTGVSHASPRNVIEVANFYCPDCYAAEKQIAPLEKAVQAQGGVLDFVPIVYGRISPWPARVYLAMPARDGAPAKAALFTAAAVNGLPMASAQAACSVVLNRLSRPLSLEACVNLASSEVPKQRLQAVMTLLHHVYPNAQTPVLFPLFIVMQDGQVREVLSRHQYPQVATLVQEVIHALA